VDRAAAVVPPSSAMTAVMPMLVVRLHVDLKRVATAVCRAA
jgi:hypothetical protein